MLACAPCLLGGLELDDVFHALGASEPGFLESAFTFFGDGPRPAHVSAADLPWWTEPGLRLDLLRPLAALTHWVDHRLWPAQPWLMHLHSLLWYGLLVGLVHRAYRRLGGSPARASLAALLYGLAQAHGMNVGWISARNSLMGAALVVVAIFVHHRWRKEGWTPGAVLGPVALAMALLSNEGAVAGLGFLVAHAIALDQGRHRFVALVPHVAVVLAWRWVYGTAGYGAMHSGVYLDPLSSPLEYAIRTVANGISMLAASLGVAVLDGLGTMPGAIGVASCLALPFVVLLGWLAKDSLRDDPSLRMWTLGAVLACSTAGTSVATDRGLLLLGVGTYPLLAALILRAWDADAPRLTRVVGRGLLAIHLLTSMLLPLRVSTSGWVHDRVHRLAEALPSAPGIEQRAVVLLNAPSDLVMLYSRALAGLNGRPFPGRMSYLYAGTGTVVVERITASTFELETDRPWLAAPLDRMVRAEIAFAPGQRYETPCFTAQIVAIDPDALPVRVRFELHRERPGCQPSFMAWRGEVPEPVELPPVGSSMVLEPIVLF